MTAPGWYHADGDAPGTQRYWDGAQWTGEPVPVPPGAGAPGAPPAPGGYAPSGQPGFARSTGLRLGTPGARMGARILDFLIMLAFAVALTAAGVFGDTDDLVVNSGDDGFSFSYDQTISSPLQFLIWGLLGWAWAFGWTHLRGGTPGKLILGMRVADAATGNTPVDVKQALIRTGTHGLGLLGILGTGLGNLSGFAQFAIGLVSLIMLFSDDENRTVMDRVAKTHVIKL